MPTQRYTVNGPQGEFLMTTELPTLAHILNLHPDAVKRIERETHIHGSNCELYLSRGLWSKVAVYREESYRA